MYAIKLREFRSEPERRVLPSPTQALPTACALLTEVERRGIWLGVRLDVITIM